MDVVNALPCASDAHGRLSSHDGTDSVVKANLVVEIVEVSAVDIVAVLVRIVYLGDEDYIRVLGLDLWYDPSPEVARHHLCHVATEARPVLLAVFKPGDFRERKHTGNFS